jgi:peptidyl-prolyl cis-trans isomerase C
VNRDQALATGRPQSAAGSRSNPAYRYHLLRAALERFECDLNALAPEQMSEVADQAQRTFDLETLVLSSREALETLIPEPRLDAAVAEVRGRYPSHEDFEDDLARNGLDAHDLRQALRRELIFDAVMQRVGASAPAVDEIEERLFFELHPEHFTQPERRQARHILITVNEAYAENRREAAYARIDRLRETLAADSNGFGVQAQQHSECPTAMDEGRLGLVQPGQLFPTLDACLFRLAEGELSGILESELGFHLILCERIEPSRSVTFEDARPKIHTAMRQRRERDAQRNWIASLRRDRRAPA